MGALEELEEQMRLIGEQIAVLRGDGAGGVEQPARSPLALSVSSPTLPKSEARVITAPTGPSIKELNAREMERRQEAESNRRAASGQPEGTIFNGKKLGGFESPNLLRGNQEGIPPFIIEEALKTAIPESAPQIPEMKHAGQKSHQAAEMIARIRHQIGLGPDFTTPQPTSAIGRGAKRFGHALGRLQTPLNVGGFIASQVPNTEAATFKKFSVDDIINNPELLKRWDALSDQERAIALMDGTNKAADALQMHPDVWDRFMGKTETKEVAGRVVETETGGLAGRPRAGAGTTAAGVGATTGQKAPAGPAPGEQRSTVKLDLSDKEEYVWIGPELPGFWKGRSFMLTQDQAAKQMNSPNPSIRLSSEKPHEVATFLDRTTGEEVEKTNRQFRSLPEAERNNLLRTSGNYVDAILPDGTRTRVREEMFSVRDDLMVESDRGFIDVLDTYNNKQQMFIQQKDLEKAPRGRYIAAPNQEISHVTTHEIEQATDTRAGLLLTGLQVQRIMKIGDRGLGLIGSIGNSIGRVFKAFGADKMGDSISQFISGGTLTTGELQATRRELQAWVAQRKDEILNDKRLSNQDMKILRETVGLAEIFTEPKSVLKIMSDLTMIEITHNELKNWASGAAQQFPVGSDEEAANTIGDLISFGFSEPMALQTVGAMLKYPELNPRLRTSSYVAP
jgi:hypothetical protein